MTKPRNRKPGMNHTVSLTREEREQISAWAAERGKSFSAWFVECALTVDPFPEATPARPLVLDAEEQRGLSLTLASAARNMRSGGEAPPNLADGLRALLEARLKAMARDGRTDQAAELLRRVLGEKRASVVMAAVLPETVEVSKSHERPEGSGSNEGPDLTAPPQPDLFGGGAGKSAGGA